MTTDLLYTILANGENSGVEFKNDADHPESIAKEIASLANLRGGVILLGVDDDGRVVGLGRDRREVEEWVMNICRNNLQPSLIPYWEVVATAEGLVGVISIPDHAPDKPYKARRGSAWITFSRVGSTSREATREEEARLYQQSGHLNYDVRPVPGATLQDLDLRRLRAYFRYVRRYPETLPEEDTADNVDAIEVWQTLLLNTDILVESGGRAIPTVGGLLLFGLNPQRRLPNSGITAVAYQGSEKDYDAIERTALRAPLTPLVDANRQLVENGLIDAAFYFVRRNMRVFSSPEDARRVDRYDYPLEAIRELITNAVVHRDYSIHGVDIELSVYSDRIECISPGRLPNTVTVEKMKAGYRATRNELIKEVLRDYNYIEATGLGIPRKILKLMREQNGTEPELIEEEDRFILRLYKGEG